MKIQHIVNSIFRQNFYNPKVLGRVIFGGSMIFLGLFTFFHLSSVVSYAPTYLPLRELLALGVGLILTVAGFGIFANLYLDQATRAIVVLFAAFILIVNLPTGNTFELAQNLAFMSAAILIGQMSHDDLSPEKKEKKQ